MNIVKVQLSYRNSTVLRLEEELPVKFKKCRIDPTCYLEYRSGGVTLNSGTHVSYTYVN